MNVAWSEIYLWLFTALFWLAVLLAVAGLVMIILPRWVLSLNRKVDIWIDTSGWFQKLDEPHRIERLFYRHHVMTGLLIVIGALYSLGYLWTLQQKDLLLLLPDMPDPLLADWIMAAVSMLLLAGNVVALVIGVIVVVRPSLLKTLETRANTWLDSGRMVQRLDTRLEGANQLISRHVRLFGVLVVIGSFYILTNTITVVLR